jgi:hypothetical protein
VVTVTVVGTDGTTIGPTDVEVVAGDDGLGVGVGVGVGVGAGVGGGRSFAR